MEWLSDKTLIVIGAVLILLVLFITRVGRKNKMKLKRAQAKRNFELHSMEALESDPFSSGEKIIALHVMAKESPIDGPRVLEFAELLHLEYGPHEIFHHFDQNKEILYSMASAIEPGTFELDNMSQFQTAGVTLFMRLSQTRQTEQAFERLLNAAKMIAQKIGGELQDHLHHPLADHMLSQYRHQLSTSIH